MSFSKSPQRRRRMACPTMASQTFEICYIHSVRSSGSRWVPTRRGRSHHLPFNLYPPRAHTVLRKVGTRRTSAILSRIQSRSWRLKAVGAVYYFFIQAPAVGELLLELQQFFRVCEENGFKVHAEKTDLFLMKAHVCSRLISVTASFSIPDTLRLLLA